MTSRVANDIVGADQSAKRSAMLGLLRQVMDPPDSALVPWDGFEHAAAVLARVIARIVGMSR